MKESIRSKWEGDPLMRCKDTDRNITPTTQQMPGIRLPARAAGAPQAENTGARRSGHEFIEPDSPPD